jgi:hypothetical protein
MAYYGRSHTAAGHAHPLSPHNHSGSTSPTHSEPPLHLTVRTATHTTSCPMLAIHASHCCRPYTQEPNTVAAVWSPRCPSVHSSRQHRSHRTPRPGALPLLVHTKRHPQAMSSLCRRVPLSAQVCATTGHLESSRRSPFFCGEAPPSSHRLPLLCLYIANGSSPTRRHSSFMSRSSATPVVRRSSCR